MRCKLTLFVAANRALGLCGAGCFAVFVRCKLAIFLTANGTLCLLCAGCRTAGVRVCALGSYSAANRAGNIGGAVAVVCVGNMSSKLTLFVAANRALGLCGAGCFAVFVRCKLAIFLTANGTLCLLCAGCGAAGMGCVGFDSVLVALGTFNCRCAIAIIRACGVGCICRSCHSSAYGAGNCCCAVAVVCVGFVILGGFACANLPSLKVGDKGFTICVFVILSAFATVVVLPTVHSTGCALTAFGHANASVRNRFPDCDDIRVVVNDEGIAGLLLCYFCTHCRACANAPVIELKSFDR